MASPRAQTIEAAFPVASPSDPGKAAIFLNYRGDSTGTGKKAMWNARAQKVSPGQATPALA